MKTANHPYAVRLSQECVELCLKSALKLVGIEYPKIHDVSPVLEGVPDRFPSWFTDQLGFLSQASASLAEKREPSFYGSEEELLAPEDLITEEEGRDAVSKATKTYELCSKLLRAFKEAG